MIVDGGAVAGRYRLGRRIGSGAMGIVWEAHDEVLNRTVAAKQVLLQPGQTESEANDAKRRVMREGQSPPAYNIRTPCRCSTSSTTATACPGW